MGGPYTEQVHDWEPGILPSGLFWTVPVNPSAIVVNPQTGSATLRVANLAVPDFHDFFNSIATTPDPAPVPSHVSFEVTWPGHGAVKEIDDADFDFSGRFVLSDATIAFTARNDAAGVVYRSNPEGQTTSDAGVGRERNGIFH